MARPAFCWPLSLAWPLILLFEVSVVLLPAAGLAWVMVFSGYLVNVCVVSLFQANVPIIENDTVL